MDQTEIKKALYKEDPKADLLVVTCNFIQYESELKNGEILRFIVPLVDIGYGRFYKEMSAKHLIRYLQTQ